MMKKKTVKIKKIKRRARAQDAQNEADGDACENAGGPAGDGVGQAGLGEQLRDRGVVRRCSRVCESSQLTAARFPCSCKQCQHRKRLQLRMGGRFVD